MKRTALRRASSLRSSPLSRRRDEQMKTYRAVRDEYLAAHPLCEFPGCLRRTEVLHHRAGRVGLRLTYVPWFAAACHQHNMEAESGDVALCRRVGWLLPMGVPVPQEAS